MNQLTSVIKTHQGNMLLVAAKQYPTVHLAMLEVVQNAVDGGAKNIKVIVNMKRRSFSVFDDGDGATQEKFETALDQVGASLKCGRKDVYGQFGLGLVSMLGKCDKFTFTSNARKTEIFSMWTFETDSIVKQKGDIEVPYAQLTNHKRGRVAKSLTIEGQSVQQVNWSSRFSVTNYTADKTVGKIMAPLQFADEVFDRFGVVMLKRKVKLTLEYIDANGSVENHVDLQPQAYQGEKLPMQVVYTAGVRTFFDMFLAPYSRGKKKSEVYLLDGTNPFRLPFKVFEESVRGRIDAEVVAALKSGYFTGEISNKTIQLHENRKEFVVNDALISFCAAIEEWYVEHGSTHYEQLKQSQNDERLQRLGRESLQALELLLKHPDYTLLADRVKQFHSGTVGKEHSAPDPSDVEGVQDHRSVSVRDQASGDSTADVPKPPKRPRQTPKKPQDDHTPLTVTGPLGQKRKVVKNDSFGLQFSHQSMPGEKRLWVLDDHQGILYFNQRHPAWERCGTSDKRLKQLQEMVAVMALHSLLLPNEWRELFDDHLEAVAEGQAFLLTHSPSFNPYKKTHT